MAPRILHPPLGLLAGVTALCGLSFFVGRHSLSPPPVVMAAPLNRQETTGPAPASAPPVIVVQTNVVAAPALIWNDARWDQLRVQPGTVARNANLAALLEKLADDDPARALALAQAEGNLKLRDQLVQAVLHGWSRTRPAEAGAWANALTDPSAREAAMKSVFAGAVAGDPEAALRLGNQLIQQNPGEAVGYGSHLIDALGDAGNYDLAARLAAGGGAGQRSIWMAEAYSQWAALQPAQAAQAASAITDPDVRNDALHGVIGGWAGADPAGLTQFLAQLPPATERGQMLGQALESWARLDPVATANWMNAHGSDLGSDLDQGLQSVATVADLNPSIATDWAENITDPQRRSSALNDVLRTWVHTDPQAARAYFDATPNLLPADRQQIAEILADMNSPGAAQ